MPKYKIILEMSAQQYSDLLLDLWGEEILLEMKLCGGCKRWKRRAEFHNQSPIHSPDLMSSQCAFCRNNRGRARDRERSRNGAR